MAQLAGVCQYLRHLIAGPPEGENSDGALLRRFVDGKDQSAFSQLMERHGPMVMRVCRQVLQHTADAEDAFQASFLVLARQARSIRSGESLSGWLYRVAFHIAVQTRGRAANRLKHEKQVAAMQQETAIIDHELQEFLPVVHEEINSLPPHYRTPVVLCYLQGLSNEEAAQQLNCPVGTVKTRLSRARDLLRTRLARKGVALTSALLAGLLSQGNLASASVSPALAASTLEAAMLVSAGQSAPVSSGVLALAEAAQQALFASEAKVAGLVAASIAAVGVAVSVVALTDRSELPHSNTPAHRLVMQGLREQVEAPPSAQQPAVAASSAALAEAESGFASETTVYPAGQANRHDATASASGRQDAVNGEAPNSSRPIQYQTRVAQYQQSQQPAAAPEAAPLSPETTGKSAPWWDWVWVPW